MLLPTTFLPLGVGGRSEDCPGHGADPGLLPAWHQVQHCSVLWGTVLNCTRFWDEIPMPGCEDTNLWSDEYWTCMCRQYTTTIYHHSGSAKMGPPNDPASVVNHQLKVVLGNNTKSRRWFFTYFVKRHLQPAIVIVRYSTLLFRCTAFPDCG